MQLFTTLKQWWNRHRTGEKTGAALTVVAIVVGVYFGFHPMKTEDASGPSHVGEQQVVSEAPPQVSPPAAPARGAAGNACPSEGDSLQSNARALSCEIVSFCTAREMSAPSSNDPRYEAYEEQVGREASSRYYARLVALVGRLNARGLQSDDIDTSTLDDPQQDCDSLTSTANAVNQLADQLKGP